MLILGSILTAVSVFLPWFHLSAPFGSEEPAELDVNPWTVIHLDVGAPPFGLTLAFLLAALVILIGSILLGLSHSARVQSALMPLLLILIFLCLCGVFLAYGVATTGLTFTSHYHTTVQYGLILFIAGRLVAALGMLMLLGAGGPRGDVWPTSIG